ncbi:MAG: hypothetical protein ACTSSI_13245 [Candidatus Helarchaeota archaeon]
MNLKELPGTEDLRDRILNLNKNLQQYMDALAELGQEVEEDRHNIWSETSKSGNSPLLQKLTDNLEEHVWKEGTELSLAMKHVLTMVMDVVLENFNNAREELAKAVSAGASKAMILEALELLVWKKGKQILDSRLDDFLTIMDEMFEKNGT